MDRRGNMADLGNRSIDFIRLPEQAAFHAASNNKRLAGDVAGENIGRKEESGVSDVVRARDLRQRHGGNNFFNHASIGKFSLVSRNDGPARANAIDTPTAIGRGMGSEAGHFIFQRTSQAVRDGSFPGGVIGVAGFAENSGGWGDKNCVALSLFRNEAEEFTDSEKSRGQNAIESLLPLAEGHASERDIGSFPGTSIGDKGIYTSEMAHDFGEQSFDLRFFAQISANHNAIGIGEFSAKGIDSSPAAAVMQRQFRADLSKDA